MNWATVTDRLIQQALLQVLQPLIDPHFSEHSHGFRPTVALAPVGQRALRSTMPAVSADHCWNGHVLLLLFDEFDDPNNERSKPC